MKLSGHYMGIVSYWFLKHETEQTRRQQSLHAHTTALHQRQRKNSPSSLTEQNEGQGLPNLHQPEHHEGGEDPTQVTQGRAHHHPEIPGKTRDQTDHVHASPSRCEWHPRAGTRSAGGWGGECSAPPKTIGVGRAVRREGSSLEWRWVQMDHCTVCLWNSTLRHLTLTLLEAGYGPIEMRNTCVLLNYSCTPPLSQGCDMLSWGRETISVCG